MFVARVSRSAKMVVGISIKDIEGSKSAMRKAITVAQKDDKITALHIPKLVPEMMLSSMNDPGDVSEDTFAAFMNMPSKAGATLQKQIKEVAEEQMQALGKEVHVSYELTPPSNDIKAGILDACKGKGADMLVLGPGIGGNGSIPPFVATKAKGLTVCIVRDHVE
mmetsp:Transcript_104557/g.223469  ORF Transcript_104557/g.223469 Transcript_104557/m.223469 type:complete len:165 (+) Transcript_104557:112-606(+)